MKEKTILTAEKFGILEKIKKIENELLAINDVVDIEFDLDGFYDNIKQVIFLTKYNISVQSEDYFSRKTSLKNEVKNVAKNNGLLPSGDAIEDYGEHFYFVFDCEKN